MDHEFQITAIFADLDGTIAPTCERIPSFQLKLLRRILGRQLDLIVVTDDVECSLLSRVEEQFAPGLRHCLHLFSDGGAVGWGYSKNGERLDYFRKLYNWDPIEQRLRTAFRDGISWDATNVSSYRLSFRIPERSALAMLYDRAPNTVIDKVKAVVRDLDSDIVVVDVGRRTIRLYSSDKASVVRSVFDSDLLETTHSFEREARRCLERRHTLFLADQAIPGRMDYEFFREGRGGLRIHVGHFHPDQVTDLTVPPLQDEQCTEKTIMQHRCTHYFASARVFRHLLNSSSAHINISLLRHELLQKGNSNTNSQTFFGNSRLHEIWYRDAAIQGAPLRKDYSDCRHPILPEEECLFLLPTIKAALQGQAPVFLARGAIPLRDLWEECSSLFGVSAKAYLWKTGSFESDSNFNEQCSNGSSNNALAQTLLSLIHPIELDEKPSPRVAAQIYDALSQANSILGRESHTALANNSAPTNHPATVAGAVIQLSKSILDCPFAHALRGYYKVPLFVLLEEIMRSEKVFSLSQFMNEIGKSNLSPLVVPALEKNLKRFDCRLLDTWEDVWRVVIVFSETYFHALGGRRLLSLQETAQFDAMKLLLGSVGSLKQFAGLHFFFVDDSALTGRNAFLCTNIARLLSPGGRHSFSSLVGSECYGNTIFPDTIVNGFLHLREKEPELYGMLYAEDSIKTDGFEVLRLVPTPYESFQNTSRPSEEAYEHFKEVAKDVFRHCGENIKNFLRADSRFVSLESLLVAYALDNEAHPLISSAAREFAPSSRHEAQHVPNMCRRIIDYAKRGLTGFQEAVRSFIRTHPEVGAIIKRDFEDSHDMLVNDIVKEFAFHRSRHKQRQLSGLANLERGPVRTTINEYLEGRRAFADVLATALRNFSCN